MATPLRFLRGMILPYSGGNSFGTAEFIKFMYEFWGYCVNGTSALQSPGGMANTMTVSYSISNVSGAGVSPIVVTTTTTHALASGQQVVISGVLGATAANGQYQITVINTTSFSLNNTTGNGAYTGGGTINTTPFAFPINFTEGTNVLAIGNDGYTSAQVSTTSSGDAIFTATTNQPFTSTTSTLTVNQATNYQTTIAAGSNGLSLPQSTINVASTITASTTIAVASNAVSLPTATINVANAIGFPSGGYINVVTTEGTQLVTYTGTTGTTFTGCSGGIGSMTTGGAVTIGFPPSGLINVTTGAGVQQVTYTGTTGTTFTGCSGGTGLMTTGGAIWAPIQLTTTAVNSYPNLGSVVVNGILGNTTANGTWTITTPTYNISNALYYGTNIAFQSNNAVLPQTTINSSTTAPFTTTTGVQTLPTATINVSATAPASNTIAAGSNNATLPTATINVASTTGFPSSGTINVSTTVSTTVALGSNGATLPTGTIFVASTSGYPTSGTLTVTSDAGAQTVTYTGVTATSFTGCSGGTGTLTTGNAVVSSTTVPQIVTYTGVTATSFTGCSGGAGTMNTGNAVNNTGYFNTFPTAGTVYINTTTGAQLVTYTGVTATTLTGCTGGSGNTSNGGSVFTAFSPAASYTFTTGSQSLPTATLNVNATTVASTTIAAGSNGLSLPQTTIAAASVAGFPPSGTLNITTSAGVQVINYTGLSTGSFTGFTGCSGGTGTMSTGGAITNGFPSSGYLYVTSNLGFQVVTYTGVSGTTFTGCSGGSGTVPAGSAVFLGYPPAGVMYVNTATGGNVAVAYTGTTATTFTGASGGSGTMATGGAITSPVTVITTTGTTLLYNHSVITSGIGGMQNANSTFLVTPIANNVLSLGNGALGFGAYTSGGQLVDHFNFILNGSKPNSSWTSGGTQQALTTNMTGKMLVMWKAGSQSSEDSMYVIQSVVGNNQLRVNLNTGGTPDAYTLHPSFTERSNINYRIVDFPSAFNATGQADGNYFVMQFNPSAIGLNPGQANSQVQVIRNNAGFINIVMSPGGNWNGLTFPVTGNFHIDATSSFQSQSGGIYNGTPNGSVVITMAADPAFMWSHFKDQNSAGNSSYLHLEIPTRLYSVSADTNPMVCLTRGGNFNGSPFEITTNTGRDYGRGWVMKGTDGTIRSHYALAKSLSGDSTPVFGTNLTDFRLAFNTAKGSILASDVILHLPGVLGQYVLSRCKLRTVKFTSTPLPLYHRFGLPNGPQFLNVQNGCAIIWDNTILPGNLFFII